jgi:hypothetical protein
MTPVSMYLSLLLSVTVPAHAGAGDKNLETVDGRANIATDTWFRFSAVTQEPGKAVREMAFEVQNMGEKRLVKFSAPSDMKGTRVLVLSRKQMWVYLPAYKKIRRVASHVKQQGFMGTMYSDEDMSTSHYSTVYDADAISEDAETITLGLSPKTGTSSGYGRLEMVLRRDIMLPSEIRFYNTEGQHLKTENRPEYDCDAEICTPRIMRMTDHTRGDAWTELTAVERRVNQGISSSIFSVRNLERGR